MSVFVWRLRRALSADGWRFDEEGDLVSSDGKEPSKDSRLFMARGTRLRVAACPILSLDPVDVLPSRVTGRRLFR